MRQGMIKGEADYINCPMSKEDEYIPFTGQVPRGANLSWYGIMRVVCLIIEVN